MGLEHSPLCQYLKSSYLFSYLLLRETGINLKVSHHPGGSLDTEGPSRLQRTLRAHAPLELRPAMDTDDDEHAGDSTESDADEEAAFTGSTYIGTGSRKPKKNGYCLDPKDPANFLKLASALNIFLADTLTDHQINEADDLI